MHMSIYFPHLGIQLEHVGKSISIFGFEIAYYGIIIGIGMIAGIAMAVLEAKRTHQNTDYYFDLAIYGILFGIIGARIYYVIFSWEEYRGNFFSIFNLRQGGLAIYGGVIAAVIVMVVYTKRKKISFWKVADTVALGLVTGQMIGRWGNFFNREAFGQYTDGLFAMQLPVDAVRVGDVTDKMRAHIVKLDGISYIQATPTFFFESVWCLLLLIVLLVFARKKYFDGQIFLMYLCGYGLGRLWIEGLRTDQLLLPGIGWPVSQLLAGVVMVVTGFLLYIMKKRHQKRRRADGVQHIREQ